MRHLLIFISSLFALPLHGDERTYHISLDGNPAGTMIIDYQLRDGTTSATVRIDRIGQRTNDYRGTESWKDGRLVRLERTGTDGPHKGSVLLVAGKDAYSLKAGVKEVRVRDDVWPTTGVLPPDHERKPLVVDTISGDVLHAKVEKVGADRTAVRDKPIPTTHYRVTAGSQRWDAWYDAKDRLVKRVCTCDGRTEVAELTSIDSD